ncbi:hypothetical protein SAMN04487881_1527 [Marinobacter sp. es.048]|uniref:hypothetical protein n=1 Tax=Marinobacter sp. es.048 TaxID=1761795 RepID=UPI000B58BF90|nr:hypothetical protein [Marinobacter sp. es.048]SNC66196.1 hypothetical protein SAMN04487881_1527 [Marinobacter sp. es.048]
MKQTLFLFFGILLLQGCQSLPPAQDGIDADTVFVSASHCLNEYLDDLEKVHYGPCLKVTAINGEEPDVREDGFVELPAATALTIRVSCVYRHADGSPIPATMENADFAVDTSTFAEAGQRWYLHAHKQARGVVGCEPTLSRSVYPTYDTD